MVKRTRVIQAAKSTARQAITSCYRLSGGRCAAPMVLQTIGVAVYHPDSSFYTLGRALTLTPRFDGPIVECGVYRGRTLLAMAHLLRRRGLNDVELIGCDSFEGFPEPHAADALPDGTIHPLARRGALSASVEMLMERIHSLGYTKQIRLMKGFFNETLPTLAERRFSLVHLDVDLYASYQTCLNFFYPRLLPGGYMVFDEYAFSRDVYPGAQRAIDEFLADKPEPLECFPEARWHRYFIKKKEEAVSIES